MNVVDSSGWLEYFGKGQNAEWFAPVILKLDELVVPTICMYEVFKRIALQRGDEEALQAVAWMSLGQVLDVTRDIALLGASLAIEYKLPMADSLILASARANNAVLWTQDAHFQGLENVRMIERG